MVVNEEEEVHQIMSMGQEDIKLFDNKKKTLQNILCKQDELIHEIELQLVAKEKEYLKKVELEESLLERCKEYTKGQVGILNKERVKVERKKQLVQVDEEENKCRVELEKHQREHQMLLIIVDNYEKEIERIKKKQAQDVLETLKEDENVTMSRENSEEGRRVGVCEKPGLFGLVGKNLKTYEISFSKDTNSFLAKKKKKQIKKKSNTSVQNTAVKAKRHQSSERPRISKLVSNLLFNQDVTLNE